MRWFSMIEAPLAFLFLGSKGESKLEMHKELRRQREMFADRENYETAYAAKIKYEILIRKKFGIGFFLSFIPGTKSFKARIDYLKRVLVCDEEALAWMQEYKDITFFTRLFIVSKITSPLFFLAKFFDAWSCVLSKVKFNILNDRGWIHGPSLKEEAFAFFPPDAIANNKPEWLSTTLMSLYYCSNPFSLFSLSSLLAHNMVDYCIEVLAPEGSWSSVILKSISAIFFIPLRLVSATLSAVMDSFWEVVGFLILEPAKFVFSSIKQTIQHWNEDWNPEILVTDTLMLQAVKVLRKVSKAIDEDNRLIRAEGPDTERVNYNTIGQQSYRAICNQMSKAEGHATRYLTIPKQEAYQDTENSSVILAATAGKVDEFNHYKQIIIANRARFRDYLGNLFGNYLRNQNVPMRDNPLFMGFMEQELTHADRDWTKGISPN